ncbi:jg14096, partial [Pararge aegeria aegeria]
MWNVESTVVSVNGLLAKSFDQHLKKLSLGRIQKAVVLETARIMYKLLLWLCLIALAQHGSMQSTLSPYVIKDIFGTPSPNDIGDTQSSYTPCTTEDGESGKCVNFYQCD